MHRRSSQPTLPAVLPAALLAATATTALAGTLTGVVLGPAAHGLPGAVVTISTNADDQARQVVTGEGGEFRVAELPAGKYDVTTSLPGFRPATVSSVAVAADGVSRIAMTLASSTFRYEPECNKRVDIYNAKRLEYEAAFKKLQNNNADHVKEAFKKAAIDQAEAAGSFGMVDGARQENMRYHARAMAMLNASGSYVFSRHEFERDSNSIRQKMNELKVQVGQVSGKCQQILDSLENKFDSRRRKALDEPKTATDEFITLNGTDVNIPPGTWNASLTYISAPLPDSLMDNPASMIYHFEDNNNSQDDYWKHQC